MNPPAAPAIFPVEAPQRSTRKALLFTFLLTALFLVIGFVPRGAKNPHLLWTFISVAAVLLCWQFVLFLRRRQNARAFEWEFVAVPSHYTQATVQFAIYVYWGWYWRNVYAEFLLILSQVVFLYIMDALLSWSRGQKWRAGFGPWPIIFSTNLFMWFRDDWFIFQFLMIATGVFAKQFIRWRREGRLTHIFNPSAFALTLFSLGLILTKTTNHTWGEEIASTQGLPPHIYTEIFLCGLVVQYFFRVTLMTFSAAAMVGLFSQLYFRFTGAYVFIDSNLPIAVFLGLHLLITDPATTPRSSIGRVIFGGLYGICVCYAFIILRAFGIPEFYDKLLVVPVLNLLTPVLDRVAATGLFGKFTRWESGDADKLAVRRPYRVNLAFIFGWTALFIIMLTTGFVEAPHPGATIGFWKKAAEENRPLAAENLRLVLNNFLSLNLDDPANTAAAAPLNSSRGQTTREQSLGIICFQVGQIFSDGKFVPADPAKAAYYFDRSCAFGNNDACATLAFQYLLAKTPQQNQPEAVRALAALEKSCTQSNTAGARDYFLVAYACELGRGLPLDKSKARRFYEQSAALGEIRACARLGRMQIAGEGGPVDPASAARWFQKAADAKDGASCLQLAKLYYNGEGVPRDESRATTLLQQACDLGNQPACEILKSSQFQPPHPQQ